MKLPLSIVFILLLTACTPISSSAEERSRQLIESRELYEKAQADEELVYEFLDWRDDLMDQRNETQVLFDEINTLLEAEWFWEMESIMEEYEHVDELIALQDRRPGQDEIVLIEGRLSLLEINVKFYMAKSRDYRNYVEDNEEAIRTNPILREAGFDLNRDLRVLTEWEILFETGLENKGSELQSLKNATEIMNSVLDSMIARHQSS